MDENCTCGHPKHDGRRCGGLVTSVPGYILRCRCDGDHIPIPAARLKPHYLPALPYLALNRAVEPIEAGLDTLGTFLVGSCLTRPDFRDVDVRTIMPDEAYDRLFPLHKENVAPVDAFWSLLCLGIGSYLERATGLPIDYQIQRQTEANALHAGPRNALTAAGSRNYPGEVPSWVRTRLRNSEGSGT